MTIEQYVQVGAIAAIAVISTSAIIANIWRSVRLNKGFSQDTMKMYMFFFVTSIIGILAASKIVTGDAVSTLLGAIAGYALGAKRSTGDVDTKENQG